MTLRWTPATRSIITIDEELCDGCGKCIPDCPEGAIKLIDGKARLVGESLCDGLGACIGRCPKEALHIEERNAEEYDEEKVLENIIPMGKETLAVHLQHLKEHGEDELYRRAMNILADKGIEIPEEKSKNPGAACGGGCPGSTVLDMRTGSADSVITGSQDTPSRPSRLRQWPVQISLLPTRAPFFENADVLIAADCTAFAYPELHENFLKGRIVMVGCPKLDNTQFYLDKLSEIFKMNNIRSLTCLHMEVPCCSGLVEIARAAMARSGKEIPFEDVTISIGGDVK